MSPIPWSYMSNLSFSCSRRAHLCSMYHRYHSFLGVACSLWNTCVPCITGIIHSSGWHALCGTPVFHVSQVSFIPRGGMLSVENLLVSIFNAMPSVENLHVLFFIAIPSVREPMSYLQCHALCGKLARLVLHCHTLC